MFAVERLCGAVCAHVFGLAVPPDVAAFLDVDVEIGAAKNDDALDGLVSLECLIDILLERDNLAATIASVRSNHDACSAVGKTVFYAFAAEAAENHAVHR